MVYEGDLNFGVLFVKKRSDWDDKIDEKKILLRKFLIDLNIASTNINKEEYVYCEKTELQAKLCHWCDDLKLDVIFTIGGVEWSPLDIVPEVTKCITDRQALSLTVALIKESLDQPPCSRGLLSRGVCGIRGSTLIINLPDDYKQFKSSLEFLSPLLANIVLSLKWDPNVSVTAGLLSEDSGRLEHSEMNQTNYDSSDELQSIPVNFTDHKKESESEQCIFISSLEEDEDKIEHQTIQGKITSNELEQTPVKCTGINKLNTTSSEKSISDTNVTSETPENMQIIDNENVSTDKSQEIDISESEIIPALATSTDESCLIHNSDSDSSSENFKTIDMSALRKNSTDIEKKESSILGSRYHFSTLSLRRSCKQKIKSDIPKYNTRKSKEVNSKSYSNIRTTPEERRSSADNEVEPMIVIEGSTACEDVYDFDSQSDSEGEEILSRVSKTPKKPKNSFKEARIYHNCDVNKEISFVPVGEGMTYFLKTHPSIRGIYLNKGKRHVKKDLVTLKRQDSAVDKGSWERKGHRLERNRFDDYFEVTEAGEKKREEIGKCQSRDEYVVNWYVWCPGHGNCYRKCGGYGECVQGCSGMVHKQDRHNCSFHVNCKIFLSDLTKWRIQLTGCHVPVNSSIKWVPPAIEKQRMNQDTRDFILSQFQAKNTSTTTVQEAFLKGQNTQNAVLTKRKISRVMWGLKKRKAEKQKSKAASSNATNAKTSEPLETLTATAIPSTAVTGHYIHVSQSSNITYPVHRAVNLSSGVNAVTSTAVDLSSMNFTPSVNLAVDLSSRQNLNGNNVTLLNPSSSLAAIDQSQGISAVVSSSSLTDIDQSRTIIDVNSQKHNDTVNQSYILKSIDKSSVLTNVPASQRLTVVDQSQRLVNVDKPQVFAVIGQSSSLTGVDQSVQQNSTDQRKLLIIQRDSCCDPSNVDVAELIQNSEIGDGDMSSSDFRAYLLSLHHQQ